MEKEKKSGTNLVLLILIFIVIVLLIAFILNGYYSNKNNIENNINTNSLNSVNKVEQNTDTSKENLNNMLVEHILNSIETYAKNGYILKDTEGDVTAEKLTLDEAQKNREKYKEQIEEMIENESNVFKLYFENKTLKCKYDFEYVINKLGIGSHMGQGIDVDENGMKIYNFK